MKMLERNSHTGPNTASNLTTKLLSGPYAPIVISNEFAQAIQGIGGSNKAVPDRFEPIGNPQELEESKNNFKVEPPKLNGHDYPCFFKEF